MSESTEANARFLQRLVGVSEIGMRVALWRERCLEWHPDEVLNLIEFILGDRIKRTEAGQTALLSLSRFLAAHPALAQKVILPAAVVAKSEAVLDLILDTKPAREIHPKEVRSPMIDRERDVTLGERRTLARRTDRDVLDRLLLDPDPIVVRNLLRNPRILERDVLKIASAQPTPVAVLQEVMRSDRWCTRRSVQLALIQNPDPPPNLARPLVELLDESGLREVNEARSIHPRVREVAATRLTRFALPSPIPGDLLEDRWVSQLLQRREGELGSDDTPEITEPE